MMVVGWKEGAVEELSVTNRVESPSVTLNLPFNLAALPAIFALSQITSWYN
jgi:hypothetical protein